MVVGSASSRFKTILIRVELKVFIERGVFCSGRPGIVILFFDMHLVPIYLSGVSAYSPLFTQTVYTFKKKSSVRSSDHASVADLSSSLSYNLFTRKWDFKFLNR